MSRIILGFLFCVSILLLPSFVFGETVDAKSFLKDLDAKQYHLETAGVSKLVAAYVLTAEDLMEVDGKVDLYVEWTKETGFLLRVKSQEEDFRSEDIRRDTNDYLDDLLLGRRFSEMLKDYEIVVEKEGKEHVVRATSRSLSPREVVLWVDKKMRVYKAHLESDEIISADFEFETKKFNGKWLVAEISMAIKTRDEENIARSFEHMKMDYKTVRLDNGTRVKFISKAVIRGNLYELDEKGNRVEGDDPLEVELLLRLVKEGFELK